MKSSFLLLLTFLFSSVVFSQTNYVTTDGVQTITANKSFTGSFYGFNGYSTSWGYGEGMQSGWLISHKRIDITLPPGSGTGAMLYISRPDNSSYINSNGGGVLLALTDGTGYWGLPTVAGDAVLRAEGPSSLFFSAASGNIKFANLPTYSGASFATQTWVTSQSYLKPASPTIGYILKYSSATTSANSVIYDNGGSIGIGTTAPGPYKLAVEGTIGAREVKVTLANPWADYVFSNRYKLTPITEVEKFIKENQHLPGVPSSEDIKKAGGINVGAMNVKMMEKIEELTLYIIELKKENNDIKKEISKLKGK